MRRAWVVRIGERTPEIDAMRAAGRIGLRYDSVGDARSMTPRDIEAAISETHPDDVDSQRARLMRFVNDIRVGDLILTPNTANHEMWVSFVTGPYEYCEEPSDPGLRHSRTVDWTGWINRGSPWIQHKLKYIDVQAAVVELRDPAWWFEAVDANDLPHDRPAGHRPPAVSAPTTASARRAAAPKTPRVTKPKPPPAPVAPKEPPLILCAGQCGFQWRAAILINGLCPDCRGD
jgi:hypothetical protein